ncbi:hypothetical protein LINPERPRIM_LOCUS11322 [Linum perenne]
MASRDQYFSFVPR